MEYSEFLEKIQKKRTKKVAKIRGSWGIYDAYKDIRKNKWYNIGRPLKEHEFYSIIREINKLLADGLSNGNGIHFPYGMGNLELRKIEKGVYLKDGKLINTYSINWNDTLRLWFEDEKARKDKTLVRYDSKFACYVRYNRYKATYANQWFYEFEVNRFIKRALKDNVIKGKIDTLW